MLFLYSFPCVVGYLRGVEVIGHTFYGHPLVEPELSNVTSYCARLYYSSNDNLSWEIYFAIMCNSELHIAVSIPSIVH